MWVGVDPSRIGMPCHERVRYASRCYGINSNRDNNLVNYPRMLVLVSFVQTIRTFKHIPFKNTVRAFASERHQLILADPGGSPHPPPHHCWVVPASAEHFPRSP